jgi:hypothetical protein
VNQAAIGVNLFSARASAPFIAHYFFFDFHPKKGAQHDRQPNRLTAVAGLGIVRFGTCFQAPLRNHDIHRVQKFFPTALPCVLLKTCLACQSHLPHRVPDPDSTVSNLNAGGELKHSRLRTSAGNCGPRQNPVDLQPSDIDRFARGYETGANLRPTHSSCRLEQG